MMTRPNKVRDVLGIIVDVNILNEEGKSFIEIDAGLLPPTIQVMGGMTVTLFSNAVAQMQSMGLDERQQIIMNFVIKNGQISNSDVQKLLDASKATATRVLKTLDKYLEQVGTRGAGTFYRLRSE